MATFKHISSKNADYGAAEQYLTFEHDEFTMKPTLDKNGQIVPRTGYLISSLNCGGEDFAIACMRSNLKYGKNQKREDVKSHYYIISFDPLVPQYGISSNRSCPPISLPPRKNGSRSDNHGKAQVGCAGFVLGVRRRTGTDPSRVEFDQDFHYCSGEVCHIPKELFDLLADDYRTYVEIELTKGRRELTEDDERQADALCKRYLERWKEEQE